MVRRRCTFKLTDLTRALKAAQAAHAVVKIEFEDGRMTVTTMDDEKQATDSNDANDSNEWDEVFGKNGSDKT
ncbi:hypothetical protein ACIPUD_27920 [Bradyrhizobium sp. CAR08]